MVITNMSGFQIKETNRIELKRELNDKLENEVVGFLNYHEGWHHFYWNR